MLSKNQEKLINSLRTKKGRVKSGRCLVEGEKVIGLAKKFVEYEFQPKDSKNFNKLVTTQTPQAKAAVAKIPRWTKADLEKQPTIVVLDGVQDPGNVGSILRLGLGFKAALVLIESADPTSPKVIRGSVGSVFQTPWLEIDRGQAEQFIEKLHRKIYRLERKPGAKDISEIFPPMPKQKPIVIVAGSEGSGIKLKIPGQSIFIKHRQELESLNVAQALAITLFLENN